MVRDRFDLPGKTAYLERQAVQDEIRAAKLLTGTHANGTKYYQRTINGSAVVAQSNILGEWHGYVNCNWRKQFDNEQQATDWLRNYPLAELS